MDFSSIDIFCHCVDNFGDAGVACRFAREFKAARENWRVRVFIDNMDTLRAIDGGIDPALAVQERESVTYVNSASIDRAAASAFGVADVMVEAFACHIPEPLMELAYDGSKLIINLEYLSAEGWVEGYHLKESLLGRGSVRKFFFMPGFREGTGGIIVNSRLEKARAGGGPDRAAVLGGILDRYGIPAKPEGGGQLVGTVFTYERGFDALMADINADGREVVLIVFGGKSQRGMAATLGRLGVDAATQRPLYQYRNISLVFHPFIPQDDYDALLCLADFNLVRGEDSLARAVLSGRPFVWNAYIQDGKYQRVKVEALLETMRPFYAGVDGGGGAFGAYEALMLAFNDAAEESTAQATGERYADFLKNLKKHERAASAMYYFILRNCSLIDHFCGFIDKYRAGLA